MRYSAPRFPEFLLRTLFATAAVLASATLGAADASQAAREQSPRKVLEALEAISPSNPDPRDLVALFQMRNGIPDEEVRRRMEDLVAVGFVIAKRQDLYAKRVRPAMSDPSRVEEEGQTDCPACGGEGRNTVKCARCGGLGHCSICKGAGKKRVRVDIRTLKGPTSAHQKPNEEFKEIPCATCRGTGNCPDCNGDGTRKSGCQKCGGSGRVWDAAAAGRIATEAYDALRASLKIKVFEDSIPRSIAVVVADGVRTFGPVFTFGDTRVVAIPARAVTGVSGFSAYSPDKRPIPFNAVLAAKNRDLVLVDLAQSSVVPPLELESDSANLADGRHVYACGTSRENDTAARLGGKILSVGSERISTSVDSKSLLDGAPLITDEGRLGGVFMYPMAEFNSFGAISLAHENGAAMRLDNLLPDDFTRVTVGDLGLCNNALAFAKRAIQAARELLEADNAALAQSQPSVSDAVKRLDRAVAMLKGVRRWALFMMEATAGELSAEAEVRARNLEARMAQIEEEKRASRTAQAAGEAAVPGAAEAAVTAPAPQAGDSPTPRPAKKASARPAGEGDAGLAGPAFNWRRIAAMVAAAIVAITVVFVLIGVIQDKSRKSKLAEPPKIPDFIREMQEYERQHPGKRR